LAQFDLKHLNVDIKGINKQGEKILKSNAKFWVVYLRLISDKLNSIPQKD